MTFFIIFLGPGTREKIVIGTATLASQSVYVFIVLVFVLITFASYLFIQFTLMEDDSPKLENRVMKRTEEEIKKIKAENIGDKKEV
jgi:uncharacterized membrane protein YdbT with pleckstrin-like domain